MPGPVPTPTIAVVKVAEIQTDQRVRANLDPVQIARVAGSMLASGQQTPIVLRQVPEGRPSVLDGHYRLAAAIKLGWDSLLAITLGPLTDPDEVLSKQLATLCRTDLNPMERGRAYADALRQPEMTAAKLASITGTSESQVSRLRALVGIKGELQELVASGKLGPSLAVLLSLIAPGERYQELLHRAKEGTLTRADIDQARKPARLPRRPSSPSPRPARRTISIDQGCSLSLGSSVSTVPQLIELLSGFLDRLRGAGVQDELSVRGEVSSLASLLGRASSV